MFCWTITLCRLISGYLYFTSSTLRHDLRVSRLRILTRSCPTLLEAAPLPAEEEAPIEAYITEVASAPTPPLPPPSFLPTLIRPPHTRAAMAQRRAAAPSTYHSLLPAGTPPLLPIPLPAPSSSRRADIPEADMPLRRRLLLTAPTPRFEVGESSAVAAARQPGSTMARRVDHSFVDTVDTRVRDTERRTMAAVEVVNLRVSYQADVRRRESLEFYSRHQEAQEDRAAVRAEIEILRRERLAYEQESIETRHALARSEAYSRAQIEPELFRVDRDSGVSPRIDAQRVANAIEAIAIYESINQTKQRENKVVGNASNKRKWEGDHNGSSNQQHKGHKVFWAHAVRPNNKKYAGSLPLCNKFKCHHNGPCTLKYGNWKKKYVGTLPLCTKCNYHHKGQYAPKCNISRRWPSGPGIVNTSAKLNINELSPVMSVEV
ncbi:hypothetical protein Tco_1449628 [Tanacetum coccineum]